MGAQSDIWNPHRWTDSPLFPIDFGNLLQLGGTSMWPARRILEASCVQNCPIAFRVQCAYLMCCLPEASPPKPPPLHQPGASRHGFLREKSLHGKFANLRNEGAQIPKLVLAENEA